MWNTFVSVILSWCSIKDDYKTLIGLEGVNVANLYTDIDDEEDDKPTPEQVDEVADKILGE